jgi:hypothetical protein
VSRGASRVASVTRRWSSSCTSGLRLSQSARVRARPHVLVDRSGWTCYPDLYPDLFQVANLL